LKGKPVSSGNEAHRIVLSVIDRLMDDDPHESHDPFLDDTALLRTIQQSIRRDLENLLNTRERCTTWNAQHSELENSLINYGLPDFTAAALNAASDPDVLIDAIQKVIQLFEPRLTEVRIRHVTDEFHISRTFQFRIEATVIINEKKHLLLYDSTLESATGQFNVK